MAENTKKLVSLDVLDYYDELNKTWTLNKLLEVSGLTEEEVLKLIDEQLVTKGLTTEEIEALVDAKVEESSDLEII